MINGALLHLAVNHIPILGLPFCFLLLSAAVLRRSRDLLQAGLAAAALVALLSIITFRSGEGAAHIVRDMTGVTREHIHDHEEAAEGAFAGTEVLGAVALLGLWFFRRPSGVPNALTALMLAGTLGLSLWLGYVAHLGGLIRHPEIEAGVQAPPPDPK